MILAIVYSFLLLIYAVFSYSLTDPNLIITSWPPYWQFQQFMWQNFFNNHVLLTISYVTLVTALFGVYIGLLHQVKKLSGKSLLVLYVMMIVPLLIAYNALSHDVFNYMFNAKMVLVYHANPHDKIAVDFLGDSWLRFMHNTHTRAPYGYGWTALSLVPSLAGFQKFLPTWVMFKAFSFISLLLLTGVYGLYQKVTSKKIQISQVALVLLNPLLLIEVMGNQHNDLWMMVPAMTSLVLLLKARRHWGVIGLSLLLLVISISIKQASIVLIPVWLVMVLNHLHLEYPMKKYGRQFWPLLASLGFFVTLLTPRSKFFLPWYLIWVMVWIPFFEAEVNKPETRDKLTWLLKGFQSIWKPAIVVLSFSSLLRYVPWLWTGGFEGNSLEQQIAITWVPFGMAVVGLILFYGFKKTRA